MKTVTFTLQITANIQDDTDPNEVAFELDLRRTFPVVEGNKAVGRVEAYTTVGPIGA